MKGRQAGQLIVMAAALLVQAKAVWAGAWTVPRDKWYVEYFYRYFHSKKEFDDQGHDNRRPKVGMFEDIRNEWKLEYGFTDEFNILASVPYQSSHYRDDNTDLLTSGVGDIWVRTKLRLLAQPEYPVMGAIQCSWKIPSAYNPRTSPALGKGQVDFETRVMISRSWVYFPYEVQVPVRKREDQSGGNIQPPPSAHQTDSAHFPNREGDISRPPDPVPGSDPLGPNGVEASPQPAQQTSATAQPVNLSNEEVAQPQRRQQAIQDALVSAELVQDKQREEAYQRKVMKSEGRPTVKVTPEAEASERPSCHQQAAMMPRAPDQTTEAPETETQTRYNGVAFVNLEGAFNARNEDPANEFPFFLEAGLTLNKRLMLAGSFEATISERTTHEQEEDFWKWGARVVVNLVGDGFASVFRTSGSTLNFEVGYNDIVFGRNTADAYEVFGKVGLTF